MKRTQKFFGLLDCDGRVKAGRFLEKDSSDWLDVQNYKNLCCATNCLKVINDTAERGVQLINSEALAKDREQK